MSKKLFPTQEIGSIRKPSSLLSLVKNLAFLMRKKPKQETMQLF